MAFVVAADLPELVFQLENACLALANLGGMTLRQGLGGDRFTETNPPMLCAPPQVAKKETQHRRNDYKQQRLDGEPAHDASSDLLERNFESRF